MGSPSPSNGPANAGGEAPKRRTVYRSKRPPLSESRALAASPIAVFAKAQLDAQLKRVEREWERCAQTPDEPAIHDLRVSLRRFGEGLWLFRRLFPKPARRQVREELRAIMRLSARVRDVDIVMAAFGLAGVTMSPEIKLFLENERSITEAAFLAAMAVGLRSGAGRRWRETLQLSGLVAGTPTVDSIAAVEAVVTEVSMVASAEAALHKAAVDEVAAADAMPENGEPEQA